MEGNRIQTGKLSKKGGSWIEIRITRGKLYTDSLTHLARERTKKILHDDCSSSRRQSSARDMKRGVVTASVTSSLNSSDRSL